MDSEPISREIPKGVRTVMGPNCSKYQSTSCFTILMRVQRTNSWCYSTIFICQVPLRLLLLKRIVLRPTQQCLLSLLEFKSEDLRVVLSRNCLMTWISLRLVLWLMRMLGSWLSRNSNLCFELRISLRFCFYLSNIVH